MKRNIKIISSLLVVLFVFINLATGFFQLCLKPDGRKQLEFIFSKCSDNVHEAENECSSCNCHHSSESSDKKEKELANTGQCVCNHIQVQLEREFTVPVENEILSVFDNKYTRIETEYYCFVEIKTFPGPSPPIIIDSSLSCLSTVIHRT